MADPAGSFVPEAHPGILHRYAEKLTAFEHQPPHPNTPGYKPHTLILIGGLGDGLFDVPFADTLAAALAPSEWSVISILVSSSHSSFQWDAQNAFASDRKWKDLYTSDMSDITQFIKYIAWHKQRMRPWGVEATGEKTAVMSHGTGNESILEYFDTNRGVKESLIDGIILQSPVEFPVLLRIKFDPKGARDKSAFDEAYRWACENDITKEFIPVYMMKAFCGQCQVSTSLLKSIGSMYDFKQLYFPKSGMTEEENEDHEDVLDGVCASAPRDYLICVLHSSHDEYIPPWIDKEKLMERWEIKSTLHRPGRPDFDFESSGVIKGATHRLEGPAQEKQRKELVRRVISFLEKVRKGVSADEESPGASLSVSKEIKQEMKQETKEEKKRKLEKDTSPLPKKRRRIS